MLLTTIPPCFHEIVGGGYPVAKHLNVAKPPSSAITSTSSFGSSSKVGALAKDKLRFN